MASNRPANRGGMGGGGISRAITARDEKGGDPQWSMKLIRRSAYGFKNFNNYRLRVIAQCG